MLTDNKGAAFKQVVYFEEKVGDGNKEGGAEGFSSDITQLLTDKNLDLKVKMENSVNVLHDLIQKDGADKSKSKSLITHGRTADWCGFTVEYAYSSVGLHPELKTFFDGVDAINCFVNYEDDNKAVLKAKYKGQVLNLKETHEKHDCLREKFTVQDVIDGKKTPQPGDVILYDWKGKDNADHIQMVYKWFPDDKVLLVIDGNSTSFISADVKLQLTAEHSKPKKDGLSKKDRLDLVRGKLGNNWHLNNGNTWLGLTAFKLNNSQVKQDQGGSSSEKARIVQFVRPSKMDFIDSKDISYMLPYHGLNKSWKSQSSTQTESGGTSNSQKEGGSGATTALGVEQDFFDFAQKLSFPDALTIDVTFSGLTGKPFVDWFNTVCSPQPEWAKLKITNPDAFDTIWNRLPGVLGFKNSSVSFFQFISLMAIFMNETGGTLLPISERIGTPSHPGISYLFDHIPGTKNSYNSGSNKLAGSLFIDEVYIKAHGNLPLADRLKNNVDKIWNGTVFPIKDFPTKLESNFITEADFAKFRGRGLIQTTFRGGYVEIIKYILNYTGNNPVILKYHNKWKKESVQNIATISTNADWDELFLKGDFDIALIGVKLHNDANGGGYLSLSDNPEILADTSEKNKRKGSFYNVGRTISGSETYGRKTFYPRVLQILKAFEKENWR